MKKYNLSNSEEILMNTLWKENAPLTVAQLSEKITEADWKPNYVDKLVKQLVKKGMVKADGIQQDRFYRSQQFVPCLAKDEFLANILEEQGVNNALFARIAVALFKKDGKQRTPEQDEKLIAELEKMVDEYESQIEEKSKENNANHHILIFVCVTMEQLVNHSNLSVTTYAIQTALWRAVHGSAVPVLCSAVIPAVGISTYVDCGR